MSSLVLGSLFYLTRADADDLFADPAPSSANNINLQQPTPQRFVWKAGMDDDQEVYLGRLALQKSQNPDVRRFAEAMIHDHYQANEHLARLAASEGLSLPPNSLTNSFASASLTNLLAGQAVNAKAATELSLPPMTRTNADVQTVQRLEAVSGPEFDRAYANTMVRDHQEDIMYFQDASQNLQDRKLRSFAKRTLPTLHKHYEMAQKLQRQVNSENSNAP